jgi:phosphonate transport system ATP-binding protein
VIGLRAGQVVLDRPVAGLDHDDAMSLYAKVNGAPLLVAGARA